jgi:hypothetical protein
VTKLRVYRDGNGSTKDENEDEDDDARFPRPARLLANDFAVLEVEDGVDGDEEEGCCAGTWIGAELPDDDDDNDDATRDREESNLVRKTAESPFERSSQSFNADDEIVTF